MDVSSLSDRALLIMEWTGQHAQIRKDQGHKLTSSEETVLRDAEEAEKELCRRGILERYT